MYLIVNVLHLKETGHAQLLSFPLSRQPNEKGGPEDSQVHALKGRKGAGALP